MEELSVVMTLNNDHPLQVMDGSQYLPEGNLEKTWGIDPTLCKNVFNTA